MLKRFAVSLEGKLFNQFDRLEVIIVRGRSDAVRGLTEHLISMRGVKTGSVSTAGSGADME